MTDLNAVAKAMRNAGRRPSCRRILHLSQGIWSRWMRDLDIRVSASCRGPMIRECSHDWTGSLAQAIDGTGYSTRPCSDQPPRYTALAVLVARFN